MKKIKKWLLMLLLAAAFTSTLTAQGTVSYAEESEEEEEEDAEAEARNYYRTRLNDFYTNLKFMNKIDESIIQKMDKVYDSGMSYLANASFRNESEMSGYESTVESNLKTLLEKQPTATKEFLMLSNMAEVTEVSYGQPAFVVLSLINLGNVDISNVVVTPKVSNDKTKWPFDISQPYDAKYIDGIMASTSMNDAMAKRMDIGWNFTVREDVLTGCYPLPFTVTYYKNGVLESTELTTYINVMGKDPNKLLIEDTSALSANPRIIVTGYTTTPETVYAGSTFTISVQVKNTSSTTTVKNVLFNLEATVEGSTSEASYAAFLPTSGSNAIYTESIEPGATYDMSIEMEAKSDLAQKPYVLSVKMTYDTDEQINVTNAASVSVPIKQASKMDISTASVEPGSIAVGEEADIMFSIYNTGKTTLYNVKVTYEDETIDGGGLTYLGNIAPGATGNVDSMVTGIAPDTGDGMITAVISYEDETGAETREEKQLALSVYEMNFDDYMGEDIDMDMPMEEVQQNGKTGMIAAIATVVAVIIVIVVVIIVVRRKKAKKKQQEDIDLLEDDK